MLRAVLRDMRAHPGRMAMTLVAIVLGVGFVVATWVVSDSAAETVSSGSSRSDVAVQVTGEELTPETVSELRALPGVTKAQGVAFGYSALVGKDGKISGYSFPDMGGTAWDSSERFSLVSGRAPATDKEVALEEASASDAGVGVGESARLLNGDGSSRDATVVGIYTYRRLSVDESTPVAAFDPATAKQTLGEKYSWIELTGTDATAIAKAVAGLGLDAKTGVELKADRERAATSEAEFARNFLLAFAGVALLAGMFVIANTFTMLVAQRSRHFALLRAVGARRGQVRRAIIAEAAVLGLIGSTIGAALGVGLGWLAMTLIRTTGETIVFAVSPLAILIGYLVGVVVTVVAAYGSARRGSAIAPVAALRADASLPRRSIVLRTVAGAIFITGGVAAVIATSGTPLSKMERAVGMGGALIAWLGVLFLAPLLASAFLKPLSKVARSATSRLAVRNAIRDPLRTAATASALMIGLALVTSFATVSSSVEEVMTKTVKNDLPAQTLAVQPVQAWFDLPEAVIERVKGMSPKDSVATPVQGGVRVTLPGHELRGQTWTAVEPAAIGTVLTPPIKEGRWDLKGGFAVSTELADEFGLKVGTQLTLHFEEAAPITAPVTGIYPDSYVMRGVVLNKELLPAGLKGYPLGVFVKGGDQSKLTAALADRPDVVVRDRDGLIAAQTEPIRLALGIISALLGAAVVIAVFGVVNTLALSVLERTREIGVFRAVGATRKLVRSSVRRESIVIASYGGVLGIGVGVLLGAVMQHVILTQPIFSLTVPWLLVGGALAGMVVVGVVAALWPARRAARTDVLAAIATA